jgi:hypothetical protein
VVGIARDGELHDDGNTRADTQQRRESLPHRLLPPARHLGHWHGGYVLDSIGASLSVPRGTMTPARSRTTVPVLLSTSYTRIVKPMAASFRQLRTGVAAA